MTETDTPGTNLQMTTGERLGDEQLTRMAQTDELQAGSYWTAQVNVSFGKSFTSRGDRVTFAGGEAVEPLPKDHWGIEAGRTHLVKRVKLAEGLVHTIVLLGHPDEGRDVHYEILVQNFVAWFRPEHDAEAIRTRELAELQGQVDQINRTLIERQNDPALDRELLTAEGVDPEPLLLAGPQALGPGSNLIAATEGITQEKVDRAKELARSQGVLAQAKAKWLSARTDEIEQKLTVMGNFYGEKAVAAIARTSDVRNYVKHLESGLTTLGLYTGDGVKVLLLRDGEEAPVEENLTVFQNKIYLDEETLIDHALGGADHRDLSRLAEHLKSDSSLLERILPMPRCVVLAQWRRGEKHYSDNGLENALLNMPNKEAFLLIRNGDRVHQVFSEVSTKDSHVLFPTNDEIADRPFRGTFGERITIDSVRFSEALQAQQARILHYRRLLILLWGLNDREQLLGSGFHDPVSHPKFLSMAFQEQRFNFVADAEAALPTGKLPLKKWVIEKNASLRSGSRVMCLWSNLISPETAPACASYDGRGANYRRSIYRRYSPNGDFACLTSSKDGPDIVVRPTVSGWSNEARDERSFSARVKLAGNGFNDECKLAFIVLDAVTPEEIEWYLNSRIERRDYLNYVSAFVAAREILRTDRSNEEAMRSALAADVDQGLGMDGEPVATAIDVAIQAWRAARRGRDVPNDASSPDFAASKVEMLNQIFVHLGRGADPAGAAAAVATERGREPLRLCLTGRNKLVLYASPAPDERLDHLYGDDPMTVRMTLEQRKTTTSVISERRAALPPVSPAGEQVIHEWPGCQSWADKPAPSIEADLLREVLDRTGHNRWESSWAELLAPLSGAELDRAIKRAVKAYHDAATRNQVNQLWVMMPIAAARHTVKRSGSFREGERTAFILGVLSAPMLEMLYLKAPEEERERVEASLSLIYRRPQSHVEHLRDAASKPFSIRLRCVNLGQVLTAKGGSAQIKRLINPDRTLFDDVEDLPRGASTNVSSAADLQAAISETLKKEYSRYDDLAVNDVVIF